MKKELKQRLSKLNKKGDALVLYPNDPNFFYFTNSPAPGIFIYDWKTPRLLVSETEYPLAKKSFITQIEIFNHKKLEHILKNKKVAVNGEALTKKQAGKIKRKVDISEMLSKARSVKTQQEIKTIRKACQLSKKVFLQANLKGTEHEIRVELENMILKLKCERAFIPIVASNYNARFPHHIPGNAPTKNGFLLDFGVKYKGYNSDISRCFSNTLQEKVNHVLDETEDFIKPGMKAHEADEFARKKLGKGFLTSLGHGIGIEVHESPILKPKNNTVLESGMVFAMEPGLYTKRLGCRIENTYLLKKDKLVNLTNF